MAPHGSDTSLLTKHLELYIVTGLGLTQNIPISDINTCMTTQEVSLQQEMAINILVILKFPLVMNIVSNSHTD